MNSIALLKHGFLPIKTLQLIPRCTSFYAIITCYYLTVSKAMKGWLFTSIWFDVLAKQNSSVHDHRFLLSEGTLLHLILEKHYRHKSHFAKMLHFSIFYQHDWKHKLSLRIAIKITIFEHQSSPLMLSTGNWTLSWGDGCFIPLQVRIPWRVVPWPGSFIPREVSTREVSSHIYVSVNLSFDKYTGGKHWF